MQRYFVNEAFQDDNTVLISGDDAKHITRVMRMQLNDEIIIVVNGEPYIATIIQIDEAVTVKKQSNLLRTNELPVNVTIVCGLPKGDKLDLITQKATELGMSGLIPFEAERSIVKWDVQKGKKKLERLQKIAKEAAEQSHRSIIPTVHPIVNLKQLIESSKDYDVLLVADEEDAKSENRQRFAALLKTVYDKQSIMVVFGPEGGLSTDRGENSFRKWFSHHIPWTTYITDRDGTIICPVCNIL